MTTLKEWRETGVRRSEEVVEIWEHVLSRSPASLSDQLWLVYEQVKLINRRLALNQRLTNLFLFWKRLAFYLLNWAEKKKNCLSLVFSLHFRRVRP